MRTRREFLHAGLASLLGLGGADWLRVVGQGATHAQSVIYLWLWGGPSQLDTWDPKPNAASEYRGPFAPIDTRVPGVRITELFPQLADRADKFALLRSLHTQSNDHGVAGTIGLTGSNAGSVALGGQVANGSVRPATGAIVARAKGFAGALPPFLVLGGRLHQGKRAIAGEGGGTLGALYDPFRLEYDPAGEFRMPALALPSDLNAGRLQSRQRLLDAMGQTSLAETGGRTIDDYRAQALALLTSPEALRLFDLARESPATLDRYGRTRFGRSCVLARRLVEAGAPYVQVNWSNHVEAEEDAGDGGWDNHYRNFQLMQDRQAPWLDQTLSALLDDLDARGLLSTTLVVAVGEFGRTPRINDKAGRDHWEDCYSALLAGGGVRGGRIVGSSDARAERPHDRPVTPADLAATVYHAVGVSSERIVTLGLPVVGNVIHELF